MFSGIVEGLIFYKADGVLPYYLVTNDIQFAMQTFPAVVQADANDQVVGTLFYPRNMDDGGKIENNECGCESYQREEAEVKTWEGKTVKAHVYVRCADVEDLEEGEWDYRAFLGKWTN